MRKWQKRSLRATGAFLGLWGLLTLWAEQPRSAPAADFGNGEIGLKALVCYNPDPFYDLDRQVCEAFASGLAEKGWRVRVQTYTDSGPFSASDGDLLVLCANTYNWSPDHPTRNYIRNTGGLAGKPVVAITLGSGSTAASKRRLEDHLLKKEMRILSSATYWLMRPNDESRTEESNVRTACDLARALGNTTASLFKSANE